MTIGEARQVYSVKLKEFHQQKLSLARQKKALEQKANATPDGSSKFAKEAASLDLSYNAVSEKYNEYHNFMEQVTDMHTLLFNAEATKQQGEAMEEAAVDLAKIMEVARRIADGGIVPAKDEKKLMEYNMELYMSSKNIAMMKELEKREKYKSMWEDDEEKPDNPDPNETANSAEVSFDAPELVDASDVIASATAGEMESQV